MRFGFKIKEKKLVSRSLMTCFVLFQMKLSLIVSHRKVALCTVSLFRVSV